LDIKADSRVGGGETEEEITLILEVDMVDTIQIQLERLLLRQMHKQVLQLPRKEENKHQETLGGNIHDVRAKDITWQAVTVAAYRVVVEAAVKLVVVVVVVVVIIVVLVVVGVEYQTHHIPRSHAIVHGIVHHPLEEGLIMLLLYILSIFSSCETPHTSPLMSPSYYHRQEKDMTKKSAYH